MNCDKLPFWLGHCQHSRVKRSTKPHAKPHVDLLLMPAKQLTKSMISKYIILAKQIKVKTKQAKISKAILKVSLLTFSMAKKSVKPLELAIVDAVLF